MRKLSSGRDLGRCCWVDLAATDAPAAAGFYRAMFGWEAETIRANGGEIVALSSRGHAVASLYQLSQEQIRSGVPAHWTPYFGVAGVDGAASQAARLGGAVIVEPFRVDGMARVSLIADPAGALLGLWELAA